MERKFFEDNELIHAVIECNYEKVKKLVQSKFPEPIYDIGGWEKQCPIFIISKAYQIIFEYSAIDKFPKKLMTANEKILNLFMSQFNLSVIDELMIEDYTGSYFETEEGIISENPEESSNFDITQDLNYALYEELAGLRSHNIIKKLCELGADPYAISPDDEDIIDYTGDDIQMEKIFVQSIFDKPKEVFTLFDVVEIIALARNIQNVHIMVSYAV